MNHFSFYKIFGRPMPDKGVPRTTSCRHQASKLTPAQRKQIEELLAMGQDCHAIAFTLGLTQGQVYRVKQAVAAAQG